MPVENLDLKPLSHYWSPRFWPMWAALALLRLGVLLPFRAQLALGRVLGRVLEMAAPMRRRVAAANLELCFPELGELERSTLLRRHFASLGMMFFELGMAWWASDDRLARLVRVDGMENVLGPLREGQGVVVLSAHFASQEVAGRMVHVEKVAAVYRRSHDPFFDEWVRRCRLRSVTHLIPKDDVRQMIRLLRKGWPVWYAPDQSYRRKHSALVPFFGQPAMTNVALSDIARIGKARVVPYFPRRLDNGYHVEILPALENFPSDDAVADARRINELLETQIRRAPEQYYWVHRRFKGRPAEFPDPYGVATVDESGTLSS